MAGEAFAAVAALRGRVRRVVVVGPAHYVGFRGIAAPSAERFATPLGEMSVDAPAISALAQAGRVTVDDAPHAPEHALEVELPFLQVLFGAVPIVPLVCGRSDPEAVADILADVWDEETLVVASSDLSHYEDYESARQHDARTAAAIERFDVAAIGPQDACGHLAVNGLLLAARRRGYRITRLDLRSSGDTAGDKRRVVGYGAWAILAAWGDG